jgi:hypothetical protein
MRHKARLSLLSEPSFLRSLLQTLSHKLGLFRERIPVVVLSVNHRTPSCGKARKVVLLSELFLRRAVELGHCRVHQLTIRALYVCRDRQTAQLAILAGNSRLPQAVLLPQRPVVHQYLLGKRLHKARNNAKGLFDILESVFIFTHFITVFCHAFLKISLWGLFDDRYVDPPFVTWIA